MYCKHCGTQNPDGVNFCTSCGASMNDEAQTVRCPNCGAQNAAGVKFCTSCGAALDTQNTNQQQNTYQQQTYQNTNGQANAQFAGQTFNFHTDPMQVQSRNIGFCIVLSIITCGIYAIVWLVQLVNDLNAAAKEPNATSGGVVFLLSIVTCGIYMLYWMYKAGELVNKAKMLRGRPTDGSNGILYLVLSIFGLGIVSYALIQNELNQLAQS